MMKFKSLLLMMLVLCLTICLCACGGNDTTSDDNDDKKPSSGNTTTTAESAATTTTTAANTDTNDTEAPTTTTTTAQLADGKANYSITVVDEAGNPIPGAMVQICLESCFPAMTNAQGVASFPNRDIADYTAKFMTVPEGYTADADEFFFEEGSYELTIVLKAAN